MPDKYGRTPLWYECFEGNLPKVKNLRIVTYIINITLKEMYKIMLKQEKIIMVIETVLII